MKDFFVCLPLSVRIINRFCTSMIATLHDNPRLVLSSWSLKPGNLGIFCCKTKKTYYIRSARAREWMKVHRNTDSKGRQNNKNIGALGDTGDSC